MSANELRGAQAAPTLEGFVSIQDRNRPMVGHAPLIRPPHLDNPKAELSQEGGYTRPSAFAPVRLGGTHIGSDTVVEFGSVVSKRRLPPNSVCAGTPCAPVRTGTSWTRKDLP